MKLEKMKYLCVIFALCFLVGCKQDTKQVDNAVVAEFQVDTTLLHVIPYYNKKNNFSVNYPKGWQPLEAVSNLDSLRLAHPNGKGITNFGDDNGFLNISVLREANKNDILDKFAKDSIWINVQNSSFQHNCFNINQYVLQNAEWLCFQLFCRDESATQNVVLTYAIKREKIATIVRSIESSIGSLNCLI